MTIRISFSDKTVRAAVEINGAIESLITELPQRTWVGLTDEDMKDSRTHNFDFIHGARWAEAKLKERNA